MINVLTRSHRLLCMLVGGYNSCGSLCLCVEITERYWTLCWQALAEREEYTLDTTHSHQEQFGECMLAWPSCDTLVIWEHIPVGFPNVGRLRSSHMRVKPITCPFQIYTVYTFVVLMLGRRLFMCHALLIYRRVAPSNSCQQVRNAHWWKRVDRSYTHTQIPPVMCFSICVTNV